MSRGSSFCYICLDNNKLLINMDRADSNKVKLLDMLTYLSFETSCIGDDIPMYICNDCHKNLRAAYDLKVMCQKNNIHVRRYIFYLKQFTHPTSFTNEPTAKNSSIQKEKPPENAKKKSDTNEIITIQMDLTDVWDESDVEIIETQNANKNEQNTVTTKVNEQESEIANTSILSNRPEFNSIYKQSQLLNINNETEIDSVNIIKPSDTQLNNKPSLANEVSTVSSQTRILSTRPEFNIYKNVNSQTDTKINNNNKERSDLTEHNSSRVNAKTKSNSLSVNNVTKSTNKKNKLLKKTSHKNTLKPVQKAKNANRANVKIETRPEFDEFDIISTVKLRKRGVVSVKPAQPMSNNSFKKRKVQKLTYHVKKDRKIIQRMNKCKVVLSRCQIVKKELLNSENKRSTDETNLEMNKTVQGDILPNSKSIEIKEETNKLENEHCTALQNNTNTLIINNKGKEQSLASENIQIKQEISEENETNVTEVDEIKKPMEIDEFSIKIEVVDDNSSNSGADKIIKSETLGEDSKNTENSLRNTETGINNSVYSFSNAEFLTTTEHTVSSTENLTKSVRNNKDREVIVDQGNCKATVGNAGVNKSMAKAVDLINVMLNENMNTTCDTIDSDISGELIIDEDTSTVSEKPISKIASISSVTKPALAKVSPKCGRKNVFKRFLNFSSNETVLNTKQGHLSAEKITGAVGTPVVDQAMAVPELNHDLSTVHLPNYKFPVSKRVLNFSSKEPVVDNSAQTSNQAQLEHNKVTTNVSKLNCKSATAVGKPVSHLRVAQLHNEHRKVLKTTGTPASVDTKVKLGKSRTGSRKLPKKVGNPVVIGSSVGKSEESPIDFMAKQMQLMMKYMVPQAEVDLDEKTTKQSNTCLITSVNSAAEGTAPSSMPAKSNQDNLTASNGTGDITISNLVHLESCHEKVSCRCNFNSHGLLSPSKITIEKGAVEFLQPEENNYQSEQGRISNQDLSLKCPICNKYFRTTLKLKKHALIHKNFYHCPICTVKFSTKAKFKVHMLVHEEYKHKCLMCDTRTLTNTALVQHYKTEHNGAKICTKCKLIFQTDSDHRRHMKRHNPKRTCAICNKTVDLKTYKTHMKSHERSKCSLCDKYFDTKQLNEHNCTEQWEKTYKCTECDRTFYFQPSLEKHMMVHYEMQCFICKITFNKPHHIVEHMSRHIGPNGYHCPICNMSTFSKDSMKRHMTDHCGEINHYPAQSNTKYL